MVYVCGISSSWAAVILFAALYPLTVYAAFLGQLTWTQTTGPLTGASMCPFGARKTHKDTDNFRIRYMNQQTPSPN
jgi:hypothetical protein